MSAFLVDLTDPKTNKPEAKPPAIKLMSADDLLHLIAEIEKKQNADARAALNLLSLIEACH